MFIKEQIQPDIVFWGGDSIAPNLGKSSVEDNVRRMNVISNLVAR